MKSVFTLCLSSLIVFSSFCQEKKDTLSIKQQFDKIYRISTSYQEYKVIKKSRYLGLQNKVQDSINALKQDINTKNSTISSQKDSLAASKNTISNLTASLATTTAEKDSISLFGIPLSKSGYNILVWSIIIGLLAGLLFFIYKFKSSNIGTVAAKNDLQELEEEFATHKKKSLEKEQKLRRQLQDEINKQRGV